MESRINHQFRKNRFVGAIDIRAKLNLGRISNPVWNDFRRESFRFRLNDVLGTA